MRVGHVDLRQALARSTGFDFRAPRSRAPRDRPRAFVGHRRLSFGERADRPSTIGRSRSAYCGSVLIDDHAAIVDEMHVASGCGRCRSARARRSITSTVDGSDRRSAASPTHGDARPRRQRVEIGPDEALAAQPAQHRASPRPSTAARCRGRRCDPPAARAPAPQRDRYAVTAERERAAMTAAVRRRAASTARGGASVPA